MPGILSSFCCSYSLFRKTWLMPSLEEQANPCLISRIRCGVGLRMDCLGEWYGPIIHLYLRFFSICLSVYLPVLASLSISVYCFIYFCSAGSQTQFCSSLTDTFNPVLPIRITVGGCPPYRQIVSLLTLSLGQGGRGAQ